LYLKKCNVDFLDRGAIPLSSTKIKNRLELSFDNFGLFLKILPTHKEEAP